MSRARLHAALLAASLWCPTHVLGGAQMYEELADSVRHSLSASLADRSVAELAFRDREDAHRWLFEMSRRLEKRIPDREQRFDLLRTAHFEALRAGLDPQLVLGIIDVESRFRKYAVSRAGARGFMQVMPFWMQLIGRRDDNLFHLRTNLRYGCVILRHYLDLEKGDLYRALGRYNGSLGKPQYPTQVVRAWQRDWHYSTHTAARGGDGRS